MKKKHKKPLILASIILMLSLIVLIIFHLRAPVLILAEEYFVSLYGEERFKMANRMLSFQLFRPIKPVVLANDASEDVIPFAIADASSNPFFVIFPYRFAPGAVAYHENNPNVPIIILESKRMANNNSRSEEFYIFKTDIDVDFYRAGYAAAVISGGKSGSIGFFIEPSQNSQFGAQALEALNRGISESGVVNEEGNPPRVSLYTSLAGYNESQELSVVILAGIASEYLDKKTGVPVIIFSWLDPALMPADVVLVIDDSPWAQALQAASLVKLGEKTGNLRSNFNIPESKNIDRGLLRRISKMNYN